MRLFNTTKKISLTLISLSYLSAAHASGISTIVSGAVNTAITGVSEIVTDSLIKDAIKINQNDCGRTFSENGKVFALTQDMQCSDVDGEFALQFSGDHNLIFLNKHSITGINPEPNRGILITGNRNHVIGSGTVEGFGIVPETGGNIVIENASFNHVSKLQLANGSQAVHIISNTEMKQANGNHIYHNSVHNVTEGVTLEASEAVGRVQANYVYNNHIQETGIGIFLFASPEGSGSIDANQIHGNHIQDTVRGIRMGGNSATNQVVYNHITRPEVVAIELVGGNTTNNLVTYNFTKEPGVGPVYCDDAGDGANNWGTNFIEFMAPVVGFPGFC